MLRHYIRSAIRNLSKQQLFSVINIVGLSVSIAVCLILFVFVKSEAQFDLFHEHAQSIYKLNQLDFTADDYETKGSIWKGGKLENTSKRNPTLGIGEFVKENIPEIENSTRFSSRPVFMLEDGRWVNELWHFADSSFFEILSFPVISGDLSRALHQPTDVVLSKATALRYFGSAQVIGEEIKISSRLDSDGTYTNDLTQSPTFQVIAVVEVPVNSSIQFDFLIPFNALKDFSEYSSDRGMMFYSGQRYATFLKVNSESNLSSVQEKINDILRQEYQPSIDVLRERRKLSEDNPVMSFELAPLKDVHYDTAVQNGFLEVRSKAYSFILLSIGLLIIIIVSINCLTLNLGALGSRKNEFGVRKVLGARSSQLAGQFFLEAGLQLLITMIIAFTLVQFLLPQFNALTGASLNLYAFLDDFISFAALMAVLLCSLMVLSLLLASFRFKITQQVNGWGTYKIKPGFIKAVTGFQFVITLFLVVLVVNMKSQFIYLMTTDMGFDRENVLVFENLSGRSGVFKNNIMQIPGIEKVSLTNSSMFTSGMFSIFWSPPNATGSTIDVFMSTVDEDFMETLEVELDSGRFFQNIPTDVTGSVLVNESLNDILKSSEGYEGYFNKKRVVGVVKNFHVRSLQYEIAPLAIAYSPSTSEYFANAYVRLEPGISASEAIEAIRADWEEVYPDRPYQPKFLDQQIANEYADFRKTVNVITYFSALALALSGMGLFGLMSILVLNRIKEVGIRKVFGASALNIYQLLSKDFVFIVLIGAGLVAYPSYKVLQLWLENFEYSSVQFEVLFLTTAFAVALVCLLVVSFHTIKTSRINPTSLIRYE